MLYMSRDKFLFPQFRSLCPRLGTFVLARRAESRGRNRTNGFRLGYIGYRGISSKVPPAQTPPILTKTGDGAGPHLSFDI